MTGVEFEEALVELFELLGHKSVERIGGFDKGADILFEDGGERVAVQAKRSSSHVGIAGVRQLIDGVKRYDCVRGLLVTNAYFTEQAVECANAWCVELWDRDKLANYVSGEAPRFDRTICAECGRSVTPGVTKFCLDQPGRFGGNVYCLGHQARKNRACAEQTA